MKTCLILGGSGFIGQSLIERLIDKYLIRVFSNVPVESDFITENIEFVLGDFVSKEDFSDILKGVDIIFHLISTTVPVDSTEIVYRDINENVIPTLRLLENLKDKPWIKLFFVSSGGTVYGNSSINPIPEDAPLLPICSYGIQKAIIEQYVTMYGRLYNIDYTIIRLSNPYGIGQNPEKKQGVIPIFIRKVLNHEQITIWGDGDSIRDYIFIDDAINAIVGLMSYTGIEKIFNVGTGAGHTVKEILGIISKKTGVTDIDVIYTSKRKCDVEVNILDNKRIRDAIGWRPGVPLLVGISTIIETIAKVNNCVEMM